MPLILPKWAEEAQKQHMQEDDPFAIPEQPVENLQPAPEYPDDLPEEYFNEQDMEGYATEDEIYAQYDKEMKEVYDPWIEGGDDVILPEQSAGGAMGYGEYGANTTTSPYQEEIDWEKVLRETEEGDIPTPPNYMP